MQVITRFRNLLLVRNSLHFSATQISSFHSTPICCDKPKKKSNCDFKVPRPLSKKQVKIARRLRRADNKKNLRNILNHCGDHGTGFQNDNPWKKMRDKVRCDKDSTKKKRPKSEAIRAEKIHNQWMRRRKIWEKYHGEDDDPETVFEVTLGGRFYTWSGSSRRSSPRFDWRNAFHGTNASDGGWDTFNKSDYREKACSVGLPKDRAVLGLSPNGPLQMKDVKNAFHLSALKWHPDKHQGPTQAAAEEKFKLCVSAYNSLRSALSEA